MKSEITKEIEQIMLKGDRSLKVAKDLMDKEDYDFAVSRAYYAMFYYTTAVLLTKKLSFSKHSGVIAAFGRYFVKTGTFPLDFHRKLRDAFDSRNVGDYTYSLTISREDAEETVTDAEEFIGRVKEYLQRVLEE